MTLEQKTISDSERVSLGKEYTGQSVLVEQMEDGIWTVQISRPPDLARLGQAIALAEPLKARSKASGS
jgi:hypothetical protein